MKSLFEQGVWCFSEMGVGQFRAGVYTILIMILMVILTVLAYILLYKVLKKILRRVFRTLERKQGHRIYIEFIERVANFALIICISVSFLGWKNIGGSLLGSAAVITGVIGFAAQDVIKDVLSGLLISIYKPFDLGDRIELDDGTVGIVESITMRHVVIIGLDTLRIVIPNSRINTASIKNYSFGEIQRSCLFKYPVGFESDIDKARNVISEAIMSSPYSIPGRRMPDGTMDYGKVYFIDMADSALIMAVTVYFEADVATEKIKDDINTRVFKALEKNNIEIPYYHTSVIIKKES